MFFLLSDVCDKFGEFTHELTLGTGVLDIVIEHHFVLLDVGCLWAWKKVL